MAVRIDSAVLEEATAAVVEDLKSLMSVLVVLLLVVPMLRLGLVLFLSSVLRVDACHQGNGQLFSRRIPEYWEPLKLSSVGSTRIRQI